MALKTRYDTRDLPEKDRFAFWRESVCESYVKLGCETEKHRDFSGMIDISRHSVLSVSNVAGLAHQAVRRPKDVRQASQAYFLLSLQLTETSTVSQFGNTALLRPGDMALYSSAEPYTLDLSDGFRQMVVQLPEARLSSRLPNAEMLTARRISGASGIGKLVRENLLAFTDHMDTSNSTLQTLLQDTLIDLIATGLAAEGQQALELSSPEQHVLLRAKSFVRSHLGDLELDRTRVAQEVGMSIRRLNEIFAKEGQSISAFIRKARLEAVAEDLQDARFERSSISEIALRRGFSNMQNFSTVFRAHAGMSPRAFRNTRKA